MSKKAGKNTKFNINNFNKNKLKLPKNILLKRFKYVFIYYALFVDCTVIQINTYVMNPN